MSVEFALDYWKRREPRWSPTEFGWMLESGLWQGIPWEHAVTLAPSDRTDLAILNITGGVPNEVDEQLAHHVASASGLPVITLYGIPVQPIFDLWEDDLIAHSFVQFLDSGDPEWPLLLPMVRAALGTMDMMSQFEGFIVTGSSKRGWTSWLTAGSGDERVKALVPRVFDNLSLMAQLRHQFKLWGRYSEMISPYIARDLHQRVNSDDGRILAEMMDPLTYAERIHAPLYAVHGLCDAYWTVDAHTLYWDRLAMPRRMLGLPNLIHGHGDAVLEHPSLIRFFQQVAEGQAFPDEEGSVTETWYASNSEPNFSQSEWSQERNPGSWIAEAITHRTGAFVWTDPVRVMRSYE